MLNPMCYIALQCCPGWVRTDMAGPKAPKTIDEGKPFYIVTKS